MWQTERNRHISVLASQLGIWVRKNKPPILLRLMILTAGPHEHKLKAEVGDGFEEVFLCPFPGNRWHQS
jgi:hypothetical protein